MQRLAECIKSFTNKRGFKADKGTVYLMDKEGNVFIKKFICHEHSDLFKENMREIEGRHHEYIR